jgi:uncharacterized protein YegL
MAMTKVLVNFIQDRSGSMQSVWQETLSGFRAFVNGLREKEQKDGVEYLFSLTTFDTLVETPIVAQPIASVDVSILAKYGPRGSTALYDAVGATIQNTEADRRGAEKIIVVVVTDGHENSSREWTKDRLHSAVDAKLNAGDWTFTYLGTQPETWDDAEAFGLSRGATVSYTPAMAQAAYTAVAGSVSRLSSSQLKSSPDLMRDFLSNEEAAAAGMTKDPGHAEKKNNPESAVESKAKQKSHWRKE